MGLLRVSSRAACWLLLVLDLGAVASADGSRRPSISYIAFFFLRVSGSSSQYFPPSPIPPSNRRFYSLQPPPPGPPAPGGYLGARSVPQCRFGSRRPAQPCAARRGGGAKLLCPIGEGGGCSQASSPLHFRASACGGRQGLPGREQAPECITRTHSTDT